MSQGKLFKAENEKNFFAYRQQVNSLWELEMKFVKNYGD